MSGNLHNTKRALWLLRWYPRAWRERYGDEFVDLMEQEMADRPHSFKRTGDVMVKGVTARLGDAGLMRPVVESDDRPRVVMATTYVLAAVFTVFALQFWSDTMLLWNEYSFLKTSLAQSLMTGSLTILAGVLVLLVVLAFLALVVSALRQVVCREARGVGMPLALVGASLSFIGYSVHEALRYLVARGGIQWQHPGLALKQIAAVANFGTDTVVRVWNGPFMQIWFRSANDVVLALTPFVFLVFALAVATVIRRMEFSVTGTRLSRVAVTFFTPTMTAFLVSYMGWIVVGGNHPGNWGYQTFWSRTTQIGFMAVITVLAGVALVRSRRSGELEVPAAS